MENNELSAEWKADITELSEKFDRSSEEYIRAFMGVCKKHYADSAHVRVARYTHDVDLLLTEINNLRAQRLALVTTLRMALEAAE